MSGRGALGAVQLGIDREPTVLRRPVAEPTVLTGPGFEAPALPPLPLDNRLVAVAIEMLLMLPLLRQSAWHPDPQALQSDLLARLRAFEAAALARGGEASDIGPARYVLCAALDEAVLSTPWGGESVWAQKSLLNQLHQENWGGEKVFSILENIRRDPDRHFELIELIDHCLSLGFQGRYRLLDNGLVQLEDLRQSLGRTVTGRKRERPQKLGPIWSAEIRGGRMRGWVPLWVVAMAALAAGLAAYTIFLAVITTRIDEVASTIRLIAPGG